jgi:polyferredoxin
MFIEGHQGVFEGYFQNTNEGQMVNPLSDEVSHTQGCHNGRFCMKITVWTSFSSGRPFRLDVRPRPHLPRKRGFTYERDFIVCGPSLLSARTRTQK